MAPAAKAAAIPRQMIFVCMRTSILPTVLFLEGRLGRAGHTCPTPGGAVNKKELLAACAIAMVASAGHAADSALAGELLVEPPTLISLGFEWYIEGDANRDAAVAVAYRRAGRADLVARHDLLRLQRRRDVLRRDALTTRRRTCSPAASSSSQENTEYEVRFTLTDPDGVGAGANTRRSTCARAPSRSRPPAARRITSIRSATRARSRSRRSPACSRRTTRTRSAATGAARRRRACSPATRFSCTPACTFQSAISYTHEIRSQSRTCCGTPWDGTFYLTQDGTAERPIAIKAAGDGEVIFDGDGNNVLFNVMGADYTYFEGITFRNTNSPSRPARRASPARWA